MPTFEVRFKVGQVPNSIQNRDWQDGMVMRVDSPGLWWTAAEYWAWNGRQLNVPPDFDTLDAGDKEMHRRIRIRLFRFDRPAFKTAYHINQRLDGATSYTPSQVQDALERGRVDRNQLIYDDANAVLGLSRLEHVNLLRPGGAEYKQSDLNGALPGTEIFNLDLKAALLEAAATAKVAEIDAAGGVIDYTNAEHGRSYTAQSYAAAIPDPELFSLAEESLGIQEGLQATIDEINLRGGYDTNWGTNSLIKHGVISVDLTPRQATRIARSWDDDTYNVFGRRRKVSRAMWRVKYETFLTAQQIADFQDDTKLVLVDRTTVWDFATVFERVVRNTSDNPEGPGDGENP